MSFEKLHGRLSDIAKVQVRPYFLKEKNKSVRENVVLTVYTGSEG